ncbi:MAG TPA: hypothetical protein VN419_03905 [Humidesulfovibrio sp.]|uniref:hypothetical protein n=1 Tax=Humidesulfovibrio sp. TaxID=2910988 RepID=UPI002C97E398|nr:hypothetical protein [Humidesulfovibrio sp.]HWR03143.1 hypothetical protein [Humidesulfovibrio sp.]
MRHLKDLLLLVPVAAIYLYLGWLNPDLSAQLPVFLGFVVAFVLLPAMGLGGILVRLPLSFAERLALGGPAALSTMFAFSYAGAALHEPRLLWLQPALGLLVLLAPLRSRAGAGTGKDAPERQRTLRPTPWGDLLLTTGVLTASLLLCLQKMQSAIPPTAAAPMGYYVDDIISSAFVFSVQRVMEHGLPFTVPMVEGGTLSYHLLYHFCYAVCATVTSIHPLDLVLFLWPPLLWLLLAGALVTGCRRLAGFSLLETSLAAVLLLFTSGVNFFSSPSVQLFDYQHTFFLGLPGVILFCAALYGYLSGANTRLFATHAAFGYFLAATTKAPLMLLLPASLLPVLLLRLVKRQVRGAELLLAGLVVGMALVLRLTLYPDTGIVLTTAPKLFKLITGTFGNLSEMLVVFGPYLVLAVVALDLNPVLRLKLRRSAQYLLFCAGYLCLSAFLLRLYNFVGGDFYFYWYARVLVFLAFVPLAAHVLVWRGSRPLVLTLVLVLLAGVGVTLQRKYLPLQVSSAEVSGVPRELAVKQLDAPEREALRWAAANLDRKRVFFTNKINYLASYLGGYVPLPLYDYLGLSGMQGYAFPMRWLPEATVRTAGLRMKEMEDFQAAPTAEGKAAVLATMPVDYYFHCVRIAPKDFAVPDCLKPVYANGSLIIYENTCRPR